MTKRAKIICTLGPAVDTPEMLKKLALAGMDCARLNFSHGNPEHFKRLITNLRNLSKEIHRPIGVLADIQGPKIRVGKLQGNSLELKPGEEVFVTFSETEPGGMRQGKAWITTPYKEFVKDVHPGFTILLDDGLMELKVEDRVGQALKTRVITGGLLKENKGINVPEAAFSTLAITEKDYTDILFCVENHVDFIAMSFVRSAQEVRHLKQFLASRNSRIRVLAKIEKQEAIQSLTSILEEADGALVARGDLAVEVGNERVPVLQKQIVKQCNLMGKTVIIATQMLMSMVDNPRPTRAEASDVANGVVDGADALMLSNETAVGKYPVEAVTMMSKIILEMEQDTTVQPILFNQWQVSSGDENLIALLQSAVRLSSVVRARIFVALTESGHSAELIAKCRPKCDILAITSSPDTLSQLSIVWGVQTIFMEDMHDLLAHTSVFEAIGQRLLALNLASTGDKIVISAGLPKLSKGSTNTIQLHTIGC